MRHLPAAFASIAFAAIAAVLVVTGLVVTVPALAQKTPRSAPKKDPGNAPFNPQEMFDRLFGESSEEDDQALEEIEIPADEETEFGRSLVNAFLEDLKRQKLRVYRKGKDVEYLARLVATLRPYMKNAERYETITVLVIDSPLTDAKSFPGGTLFFYTGLLRFAENEAALVGVIGHELSHLDHGHQLLPLKRSRLMQRTAGGGASFDPQQFFKSSASLTRLMSRPFRPQDESTADRDGATWAHKAGYDSRELAGLLYKMHDRDKQRTVPLPSFFRTHPYHQDRYDALLKVADELQESDPRDPLYRGKTNLQQRIARSQKEFPE